MELAGRLGSACSHRYWGRGLSQLSHGEGRGYNLDKLMVHGGPHVETESTSSQSGDASQPDVLRCGSSSSLSAPTNDD